MIQVSLWKGCACAGSFSPTEDGAAAGDDTTDCLSNLGCCVQVGATAWGEGKKDTIEANDPGAASPVKWWGRDPSCEGMGRAGSVEPISPSVDMGEGARSPGG
jgi:hypothetical protein